ncbi:MAG: hypothetical protein WAM69_16465 [Candidatus Sulfotelmatobacter sp.]
MADRTYNYLATYRRSAPQAPKGLALLKSILVTALAVSALTSASLAAELPEAPSSSLIRIHAALMETTAPVPAPRLAEANPIDGKFLSLAFISTGSTFADSYTTLFARQNWLARKPGVCNVEVQSPYLYGTHPTVGRAYAVASVKSVGSILAAYYLRKHHSKLWALPLFANSAVSLEGVTQNMIACN